MVTASIQSQPHPSLTSGKAQSTVASTVGARGAFTHDGRWGMVGAGVNPGRGREARGRTWHKSVGQREDEHGS